MKTRTISVLRTLLVALALLLPLAGPAAGQAPAAPVPWTVMVYMDGDNNLENWVVHDIERELSRVGSSRNVNVLVLADRIPGYNHGRGDWTSAKLFYVRKGMRALPNQAIADWGERNMGDPQTLVEFVQWSRASYPADHYALILWDHGWAWRPEQTMWDETSQDALDPDEIVAALPQIGPLDVVGYDACEQQVIEIEATWRGYTQAIAASQEDVGYSGFVYDQVLAALKADPGMTGEELAVVMAKSMTDKAVAAVALNSGWDELETAVDAWSVALLNGLPQYRAEYDAAWQDIQRVADPFNKDLYDAALEIKARVPDPEIQARSQDVIDAMDSSVVLYEWHANNRYRDAHGIGIFWPQRPEDLTDSKSPQFEWAYYRDHLLFSLQTHWDEFLDAYVNW